MGRTPKAQLSQDLQSTLRQIGVNLVALREEKGISQAELARRSKISTTTVNEIETRQFRDIRLSTLSALATTLEISVMQLLQTSDIELSNQDQIRLLKASEAISRISRKLRT